MITGEGQPWQTKAMSAPTLASSPSGSCLGLNLSGLDLGGASSPGPATDGSRLSNLEPEHRIVPST